MIKKPLLIIIQLLEGKEQIRTENRGIARTEIPYNLYKTNKPALK